METQMMNKIKLVATDCDGVLTDGGLYYTSAGDVMKKFNVLDGMGFILLKEKGIITAIITAESNELLDKRAEKIKVDYLIKGSKDKLKKLEELCEKLNIKLEETAYIGDDIYDIPAIERSGLGCAPKSALEITKKSADYITKRKGGEGCFRELADLILNNYC